MINVSSLEVQQIILDALKHRDCVLVSGDYIGDVLSLQAQGLVTSRITDDIKLEVRRAITVEERKS